ncbi:MAG: C40 family peptidase [Bryobacteraceae bacterium]
MKFGIAFLLMAALSTRTLVTRPVANLYKSSAKDVEVVSQAIYGTEVEVLEEKADWIRVRTPDAYQGWMWRGDVICSSAERPRGKFVSVSGLFANLYAQSSISKQAPLLTVPYETKLEQVDSKQEQSDGRWLQVYLVDGGTAWVEEAAITAHSETLNARKTIEHAKRFVGLPYLWGGVSTYGFDCSGFVQMLGRRRGVNLPRDARLQVFWNGFQEVEKPDWRPGDFLYFGQSLDRVTHTGMYIGGGMMIHAASPYIRIQAVDEVVQTRGLVFGRRLK